MLGVNSFGAESDGTDSEFYFAVSTRELLPFLRKNNITAQLNGLPCRSLAELDAAERARAEREQLAALRQTQITETKEAEREAKIRRDIEFEIMSQRDDLMMLAMLLMVAGMAGGFVTWRAREANDPRQAKIAAIVTAVTLLGGLTAWFVRPGFNDVDAQVKAELAGNEKPGDGPTGVIAPAAPGGKEADQLCVVDVDRSRITTARSDDVPLSWSSGGCINGHTQYGLANDAWSRIFVPSGEASVSVNSYNPDTHEYRVDRYLLDHDALEQVRNALGKIEAPQCGDGEDAARKFGQEQAEIETLLPSQPNERLVYSCAKAK